MASNIGVSLGGVTYTTIPANTVYYSGKVRPGNTQQIAANIYYKFGEVSVLTINFENAIEGEYNEYLFEFTATGDLIYVNIRGQSDLRWAQTPHFRVGYKYQISVLNNAALWTEVPVA